MNTYIDLADSDIKSTEKTVMHKVAWRIIPIMAICYFFAFLDRINVGMAALTMNESIGLSAVAYGLGASMFFVGYVLFEVPSNIAMQKVGARIWITRIMITWGLLSTGMALVVGPASFYTLRFVIGAAEAGFFPGLILYFSWWFPATYRARMTGMFVAGMPVAILLGAPVSGMLLNLHGFLGLAGWQWMFVIEGVPAAILGVVVFFHLTDRPSEAKWLSVEERNWLVRRMESERQEGEHKDFLSIAQAFKSPKVLTLSAIAFGMNMSNYGLTLWLPQIVKSFGLTDTETGFITAIPFLFASISSILWTRSSDRTGERFWHLATAAFCAAGGLAISAYTTNSYFTMAAISVAAIGTYALVPMFWGWAPTLLAGTGAAAAMALINSIGAISGYVAPYGIGLIRESTGSFSLALLGLSMGPVLATILIFIVFRIWARNQI
ncbi:MFS transporter [Methylobacterium sp. WL64]|uniref:MFS transporter n=1 Tax=Methylobacterium sp. WL64 TaxID=2603894 RepID=UPI0011CC75E8|nr:MFS transporter [Methylobacterium sp. WL64]TXM96932.1 MFS transporter [Methylobacterium sp. WL64]